MMDWWFLHTKNIEDYNYCKGKFGPNKKKWLPAELRINLS